MLLKEETRVLKLEREGFDLPVGIGRTESSKDIELTEGLTHF